MVFPRKIRFRLGRDQRRRVIGCASLAMYVVVASGMSLPLPRGVVQHSEERYPCENSSCGCPGPEHCWRQCCCHSLEEKLAWSHREGVRPPDFILARTAAQGLDVAEWVPSRIKARLAAQAPTCPHCSCCATKQAAPKPVAGCCTRKVNIACRTSTEPNERDRSIVMWQALKCHGLMQCWLALGIATLPPVAEDMPELLPTLDSVAERSESFQAISYSPDLPPPEDARLC